MKTSLLQFANKLKDLILHPGTWVIASVVVFFLLVVILPSKRADWYFITDSFYMSPTRVQQVEIQKQAERIGREIYEQKKREENVVYVRIVK